MGGRCELNNLCASQPCGHGSLCVPKTEGYICNCSEEFPGRRYDVPVSELSALFVHLFQLCIIKSQCGTIT